MKQEKYDDFVKIISRFIDRKRIFTDDLRRIAWGADAGFYHLTPKVVVNSANDSEVEHLLKVASSMKIPVTFRAAGTSLSGQAISDSVLVIAGKNWEDYTVSPDASTITMQPGIVGNRVNEILKPYGRTFTPDPASKNSAMVGGIVINNASGMNCGTHANSDKVLKSVKIILADGTRLDTGDPESCRRFAEQRPDFIKEIETIRDEIKADPELVERIKYKYSIKNVTGLNILPFIEYDDPFEIIAHLMVGSEGTLAFLSEVTMFTGHLYKYSASALLYFSDPAEACRAVVAMKEAPVFSAELFDKKSLESINDTTGKNLTALLVETKADSKEELDKNINDILQVIDNYSLFKKAEFTDDPAIYSEYWKKRSGIFPSVGGTRPLGTTVLIEDIAFHIQDLPHATLDLIDLLEKSGYNDACIYGHVLEGNYHFIISQSFDTPAEIDRYRRLMEAVEQLVVNKYDGSLKAEHGTGRNMAPFVKREWGTKAWEIMLRLKKLFDPDEILNPGVIFDEDPLCFIKNIKYMPLTNDYINRCIECGFCEVNCVSAGYTLSARQRIVVERHLQYMANTGVDPAKIAKLRNEFYKFGVDSCAGDGLCSTSCPMKINTADLIHDLRAEHLGSTGIGIGKYAAKHIGGIEATLRPLLSTAYATRAVIGDNAVNSIGRALNSIGIPLWTSTLPDAYYPRPIQQKVVKPEDKKVVYFPSCINRTMGASHEKSGKPANLVDTFVKLCNRAGYEVIFPENMKQLCCGMIWESKGMPEIADGKTAELEKALLQASQNGLYPVVCDQSPCLHRMRDHIKSMKLYEPAEFITDYLAQSLKFNKIDRCVAVHVTCSTRLMNLGDKIIDLASRCATNVVVPSQVGCCGFAGDKGFMLPGLNRWGLRKLRSQIEEQHVVEGYSNSRTCEIGLSTNSGIPYKSIVYLVEEATRE